jgi:tRNA A-37 threonylcarbamoyl transferase component Bud32
MEPHVSAESFDSFLRGTCGPDQASRIEAHIDVCEDCRVLLSSLARSQRDLHTHTTDVLQRPLPLREGDTIGAKYRVERILGTGGMGTVVAAWHQQLNQRVALKFMLPALSVDPQAVARFQREARAAARLKTEHAGRVLDLDALPDGTPFLVMEFLEGETLEQRLERDKRIAPHLAVDWARQALEALMEAHALGIVHRDLKPANLFLARRADGTEVLKVVDFGIAKSAHPDIEHGLTATSSRVMVGSPPYMSPEQLNPGAAVTARADVWAMGAVLYQLLTGQLPFARENLVDLMYAIQNKPHRPARELVPELPVALSAVVDACLQKKPEQRPTDAAALLAALDTAEKSPAAGTVEPASRPARGLRRWIVPVAAGLVAGLLGTFAAVWQARSEPAPIAPALVKALPLDPPPQTAAVARPPVAPVPAPAPLHPKPVAVATKPPPPKAHAPKPSRAPSPQPAAHPAANTDEVYGERR